MRESPLRAWKLTVPCYNVEVHLYNMGGDQCQNRGCNLEGVVVIHTASDDSCGGGLGTRLRKRLDPRDVFAIPGYVLSRGLA